ncbi:unnamed protein product [marine sediment metagenome]|uniref:Uncharacterized protein n=1 Tax=marine sediment metagenome TaxID=412755 RepID=X1GA99_9ZZZZ
MYYRPLTGDALTLSTIRFLTKLVTVYGENSGSELDQMLNKRCDIKEKFAFFESFENADNTVISNKIVRWFHAYIPYSMLDLDRELDKIIKLYIVNTVDNDEDINSALARLVSDYNKYRDNIDYSDPFGVPVPSP